MALIITPGPLPDDGTRIKISATLNAFVSGTLLQNFGEDEFSGESDITFMVSQTDAPATNIRTRSTFWFKRGEGVAYLWTLHPSPTEAPTAVTEGNWVAVSNRKEQLVQIAHNCLAGQIIRFNTENSNESNFGGQMHRLAVDGRFWALCSSTTITNADPDWVSFHPSWMVDPCLVAATDASHGSFIPAAEWGFVNVKSRGADIATGDKVFGYFDSEPEDYDTLKCTNHSAWTNTLSRVAYASQSGVSNATASSRRMFLAPSVTNLVRGRQGLNPF
ncbi:MAG: hypothetical protein V3S83_12595 [Gemmatimonadota bacterium]